MNSGASRVELLLAVGAFFCACGGTRTIADPIRDIPLNQQRTVRGNEFDRDWPFQAVSGTLACHDGAVMFRAAGITYALNEPAKRRFSPPDPIRRVQSSAPSNPLPGVTQDRRMRIFADATACERQAVPAQCRQRLRERMGLTEADLAQVDVEGKERRWPPLAPELVPLDAVLSAGQRLCPNR